MHEMLPVFVVSHAYLSKLFMQGLARALSTKYL